MGKASRQKALPGDLNYVTDYNRKTGTLTGTCTWYHTQKAGMIPSSPYMGSPVWAMKKITSTTSSSPGPKAESVNTTSETRVWCPSIRQQDPTGPYELSIMMYTTNARNDFNVAATLWLPPSTPSTTDQPPPSSPQQQRVPHKNKKEFPRLPKTVPGSWVTGTEKPKMTGFSVNCTCVTRKSWAEVASVSRDAPPSSNPLVFAVAAAERELRRQERLRHRHNSKSSNSKTSH